MFVMENEPDVHVHAEIEDALTLDRTDINFEDLTENIVRISVRIHNRGWRRSAPTTVRLESAPLGAFVPWQPLAVLPLPPIEPGESRVVSINALRHDATVQVRSNQLPPPGTFSPSIAAPPAPQPPVAQSVFDQALAQWLQRHRSRRTGLQRPPQAPFARPTVADLGARQRTAGQVQLIEQMVANLSQKRVLPQASIERAFAQPTDMAAAVAAQRARGSEQMRVHEEIRRIMRGERPVPEGAWAVVRRWEALRPGFKPVGANGLPTLPILVNAVRQELRAQLAASQGFPAAPGQPGNAAGILQQFREARRLAHLRRQFPRGLVLAPSPMDAQGRRHFYWAGNINVFVGNRAPIERHMANGTRVYPGAVNSVLFEVGGGTTRDAFMFQLKGSATDWKAELHSAPNIMASMQGLPGTVMEQGKWFETAKMMLLSLRMSPPADCGPEYMEVQVTRRSCGSTAIVEFSLDPDARGVGCYLA
jgi:hypothetical protein